MVSRWGNRVGKSFYVYSPQFAARPVLEAQALMAGTCEVTRRPTEDRIAGLIPLRV